MNRRVAGMMPPAAVPPMLGTIMGVVNFIATAGCTPREGGGDGCRLSEVIIVDPESGRRAHRTISERMICLA